jgi:Fe2+ or Zn2+ uptake regulation protein
MSTSVMETSLAAALRTRGQRVTPQRLVVARVLEQVNRHVTAEAVHREVLERVPGVSLPTVYATLDLLEELDLVHRVATGGGSVVYDPRTDDHHHLVCRGCGAIVDVEGEVDPSGVMAAARAAGLQVDQAEVLVRGLCADCATVAQNGG